MPPNCSRCARWRICTWRGKNCCSWHRLSPGAKVADHGRAAQAGGRPEKSYLEDTGLFRVSLTSRVPMPTVEERLAQITPNVERAKKHLSDVNVDIVSFLKTEPYKVSTKRDPHTRKLIYYVSNIQPVPNP